MSLPIGFQFRASTLEDASAVACVLAAVEIAETGESSTTGDDVLTDWSETDLAEESAVVVDTSGDVVALVDVVNYGNTDVSVYGFVHPKHQGMGIGRALVDWGERWTLDRSDRAPSDARITARHYIRGTNDAGCALLQSAGYEPIRTTWVMETPIDGSTSAPVWPDGISVRTHQPGTDDYAVWETVEDTFQDLWGRPRNSFERFMRRVEATDFDPDLWFLAMDGDRIAGISLCRATGTEGHVGTLGVRRDWRGRGLGLALLRHGFAEFHQRGLTSVWLSVDADSPTGAPRLYERAGMHVKESYIVHLKVLRPGVDYSQYREDTGT